MFMSSEWTQSVGFWFTYKYVLCFYFRRLPIIVQVISVSISVDIVKLYIYIYIYIYLGHKHENKEDGS